MPDETMVEFMLAFEDQASDQLREAQSLFDVTSAAFESGINEAVVALEEMEAVNSRVGDVIQANSARMETFNNSLSVMRDMPEHALFKEEDFEKAGEVFFKKWDEEVSASSFAQDISAGVKDGVSEAELEAIGAKERASFLEGDKGASPLMGADDSKGMAKLFKALSPLIKMLKWIGIWAAVLGLLTSIFEPFIETIVDFLEVALVPIQEWLLELAIASRPLFEEFAQWVTALADFVFPYILDFVENTLVPGILDAFDWMVKKSGELWKWLGEKWVELKPKLIELMVTIVKWTKIIWKDWIKPFFAFLITQLPVVWGYFKMAGQFIADVWEYVIKPVFMFWLDGMIALGETVQAMWSGWFKPAFEFIIDILGQAGLALYEFFSNPAKAWESAKKWITGIWTTIKDTFSALINWATEAGSNLIKAFGKGISSAKDWVVDKAKSVWKTVRSYMPFSDAEVGPFSDLTYSGGQLVRTFAKGMEGARPAAISATDGVVRGMETRLAEAEPMAVPVVGQFSPGEGEVPTFEGPPLTPEEEQKPLVEAIREFQEMVRLMFETQLEAEGEKRVRRELSLLSGFEV